MEEIKEITMQHREQKRDRQRNLNSCMVTAETHFTTATERTLAFQWSLEEIHTPHSIGLRKRGCDHLQEQTETIKHNNN